MLNKKLIGGAIAVTMALTACGNNEAGQPVAVADGQQAAAPAPAPAAAPPAALLGNTDLGSLLVGSDGRTLYGFTNDTAAASTCYGGCADAWPPVIVDQQWTVGPGLDLGIFATTVRDDGRLQLVAGKWPLYFYAGDAVPGDTNGQGSGDVWFAVDTGGALITDAGGEPAADTPSGDDDGSSTAEAAASAVAVGDTTIGQVLIDADGLTLYGFTNDVGGVPSCEDACADAWPPVVVDAMPPGLDPAVFSLATRPDGSSQLVAGTWPLYRFAGDAAPGDVNGQESGGVWFAAAPDGSLIGATANAGADSEDSDSDGGSGEGY